MSQNDRDATPAQEAQVSRLLADARHGDPIPVDVATRLERVLEQLAEEGEGAIDPVAPLIDLAAARRRRRAVGLLAVAAAVAVVGVGLGQLDDSTRVGSQSADQTGARAESERDADASVQAYGSTAPTEGFPELGADEPELATDVVVPRDPIRLTKKSFAQQVARFQNADALVSQSGGVVDGATLSTAVSFMCEAADFGAGRLLPVLYDDVPAVLVYRFPTGNAQTVDLLRCGTAEILRSTVVPLP